MIVSGSFVAFGSLLPTFIGAKSILGLSAISSGAWSALFSVLTIVSRPIGGHLADRHQPNQFLMFALISIVFSNILLAMVEKNFALFIIVFMMYALLVGLGNGVLFKMTVSEFKSNVGSATGFVGAVGSFGGFVFPFIFSFVQSQMLGFLIIGLLSFVAFVILKIIFD